MQDTPANFVGLIGSFPWTDPQIYQNQSAIYYFDRIRTPTHIVAGTNDIRVPFSQSLMLERGLRYLGIPGSCEVNQTWREPNKRP
jgi:dipeptidyl aminopeptidase/acylaminoacyl peptidase